MGRTENRLAGWGSRVDARRHTERLGDHEVREPDAPMEHGDAIRKTSLANKVGAINAKLAGARVQSWVTFLSTRPSAHHLPKATTLKAGCEAARLERDHGQLLVRVASSYENRQPELPLWRLLRRKCTCTLVSGPRE